MTKTEKHDALVPVLTDAGETRRREGEDDPIEVGQWYWVKTKKGSRLGCVVHVGSNFAKLEGVEHWTWRIHFDEFDDYCELALTPQAHINAQIEKHQHRANVLMDKVKQLTATLGIQRSALTEGSEDATTALAVAHGTENIQAHKKALIKAKEKTLPGLFKEIKDEHEAMATWMKANLIPMHAQAKKLEKSTEAIEDRIFTVELYAGLTEDVELIRDGDAASNDEQIALMQRRHYMDEECLIDYTAGGMEFTDIRRFEKWLLRTKARRDRIFPFPRCVVAFRVRRKSKKREAVSLSDFIHIYYKELDDKATFLYIRNGEKYYRLSTAIDFGAQLFPDRTYNINVGGGGDEGPLYADTSWSRIEDVITEGEYLARKRENEEAREKHEEELKAWRRLSKEEKKGNFEPWFHEPHRLERFEPCTPESTYYDDIMQFLAREAMKHNRVATVLQGLLDRSPVFNPHPPWQLFTPEGFSMGLHLVYDDSRALTNGDPPDFEAFRQRLNEQLGRGSFTVGQQDAWERHEADKKYERDCNNWRVRDAHHWKHYTPYGNPGPGFVAQVVRFSKAKRTCTWEWQRERQNPDWVPDSSNPGYMKRDPSTITTRYTCSVDKLLNVSAYQPGDYKQFYNDPRTRADYLQWAPMMLAAEDWHHEQAKKAKEAEKEEERKAREMVFGKEGE